MVEFLILGFNPLQIKFFCVLFNWSIMEGGIVFTRARLVILDIANDLKILKYFFNINFTKEFLFKISLISRRSDISLRSSLKHLFFTYAF